jgi:phosphohistidine swiveling domain-containing protein
MKRSNGINGICVSAGSSKGQAVVMTNTMTKSIIPNSKPVVLVIPKLDRDLIIQLTTNVVGIISEKGSIGSHGAGILRELKIPCIVRIHNACKFIDNGDEIEIDGENELIYLSSSVSNERSSNPDFLLNTLYSELTKDRSNNIRLSEKEDCYRPDRSYQNLRYDILKPAWENSPCFLFNLPKCYIHKNNSGVVFINKGPRILDVCSYVISNPDWFFNLSYKRSDDIREFKTELNDLYPYIKSNKLCDTKHVFLSSMTLYQRLFEYIYLSQYISDEILEIFIDLVRFIEPSEKARYISLLESDYVNHCLASGVDPGISQKWKMPSMEPFIWQGEINYNAFTSNKYSTNKVYNKQIDLDYLSLLKIVPLIYQMSEEFFYISSSINSFLNRSIEKIGMLMLEKGLIKQIDDVYDLSLDNLLISIDNF